MNSTDKIYSPLDGDLSLQTRFSYSSFGFISPVKSPIYKHHEFPNFSYPRSGSGPRRNYIPRKPVPRSYYRLDDEKLKLQTHTDTFSTMQTIDLVEEAKDEQVAVPMK